MEGFIKDYRHKFLLLSVLKCKFQKPTKYNEIIRMKVLTVCPEKSTDTSWNQLNGAPTTTWEAPSLSYDTT